MRLSCGESIAERERGSGHGEAGGIWIAWGFVSAAHVVGGSVAVGSGGE
jgi:hypothetical protein